MLTQPPKKPVTLTLSEPEIPGRTEPQLPNGEWGINLAAAKGNFPDDGLKIYVPVWNNKEVGDVATVLLDGDNGYEHEVTEESERTERTTLWVRPNDLHTGSHTLTYRVHQYNQTPQTYVPPVRLYVKLEIPGGQDLDEAPGSHSNLAMAFDPPEVVHDGVDKDSVAAGVKVIIVPVPDSPSPLPYPNMARGDVVVVSWGGVMVHSAPVTDAQVSDPVNNPLIVHITEAIILEAGDSDDSGLAVTFNVKDIVNNQSQDWCTETRIRVGVNTELLIAPIVDHANGSQLDLDTLGDAEVLVRVFAQNDFAVSDYVIMHMTGTTVDGEKIDSQKRHYVEKAPAVLDIRMPNSDARKLAKTQVIFYYQQERGGSILRRSKGAFINIVGEATRLLAPIIEDELQGAIDPDLGTVRMRIPFNPRITADTAVQPRWAGRLLNGGSYDPYLDWVHPNEAEANDPDGFIIRIEAKHIKPLEGGYVIPSYILWTEDNNGNPVDRESAPASRLRVGDAHPDLVKPNVLGEANGALDPANLPGGGSRLTAPRPVFTPSVEKDKVTYTWIGEVTGRTSDSVVLNDVTANEDVPFSLPPAFVSKHIELNRGKKVDTYYEIWRSATGLINYSHLLTFVVGSPLVDPTITEAKDTRGEVIPEAGITVDTAVTLTGTAANGRKVQIFDGATSKGEATADERTGIWSLTVTGLAEVAHRFTAIALYGSGVTSAARTLTVTAATPPSITWIREGSASGAIIPYYGYTVHNTLFLSGVAAKGQKVLVGNGASTPVETVVTAHASTGIWTLTVTALVYDGHRFNAKALYGSGVTSPNYYVVVVALETPTLTSVRGWPSNVEIPERGTTVDTTLVLSGTASLGQTVEIFDGSGESAVLKGEATATPHRWELTIQVMRGSHRLYAKSKYHSTPIFSNVRNLTVVAANEPSNT